MKLQKNRKSNDHIHSTVAAFWNLYWKYKISRLKATWSKQSFYSDATSFLQWDRKFHMNAGWKSPHLAGPAHLIWTAPMCRILPHREFPERIFRCFYCTTKIKLIQFNFISLSGIGMGRVKDFWRRNIPLISHFLSHLTLFILCLISSNTCRNFYFHCLS